MCAATGDKYSQTYDTENCGDNHRLPQSLHLKAVPQDTLLVPKWPPQLSLKMMLTGKIVFRHLAVGLLPLDLMLSTIMLLMVSATCPCLARF
jgi:hypothetical protein